MVYRINLFVVIAALLTACGGSNSGSSSSDSAATSSQVQSSSTSSVAVSSASSSSVGDTEAQARCSDELAEQNRTVARTAIEEFFIQKDFSAADRYWADPYLQHNPGGTNGLQAFKDLFQNFLPTLNYQLYGVFAECDLAIVYGRYVGITEVMFDMFRLENGRFVEHWDSGGNQASGGARPLSISDPERTHINRELINNFYENTLLENNLNDLGDMVAANAVIHRNASTAGAQGFRSYIQNAGIEYVRVHHVIADGDFVFVLAEARLNGQTHALYDLYRLDDGMIVEHWDSRLRDQATLSGLGIF